MRDLFRLIGWAVVDLFRPRAALEAEIWTLRQQINILRRTAPKRLSFSILDRLVFVGLYRLFPKICEALAIVKPDTIVRWHRAGFRLYWCWKSRRRGGRPTVPLEIRKLIREMSIANPLWGAPRIHGELLKVGIDVGQTSVAKYMAKRRGPPSRRGRVSGRAENSGGHRSDRDHRSRHGTGRERLDTGRAKMGDGRGRGAYAMRCVAPQGLASSGRGEVRAQAQIR
jgi:hypothetical protein